MDKKVTQSLSESIEKLEEPKSKVITENRQVDTLESNSSEELVIKSKNENNSDESKSSVSQPGSTRTLRKRKPVGTAFEGSETTASSEIKLKDNNSEPVRKKSRSEILKEKRDLEKEKRESERLQRETEREEERVKRELVKEEEKKRKEEERQIRENEKKQRDLVKEKEKRLRAQQREDEKRKRDQEKEEERKKKDDEKRQKDLERELIRVRKETEKEERRKQREQTREDERRKKEEEIASKERQQKRIANFFFTKPEKKDILVDKVDEKKVVSDFDKCFLPFYVKADASVYPVSRFFPSLASPDTSGSITIPKDEKLEGISNWLQMKRKVRGYTPKYTAREVVNMINQSDNIEENDSEITAALAVIPYKVLQFVEDIRPPYMGTFSRERTGGLDPTNPYFTDDPKINYEYDSEVEWVEEDEDGEDLDGEDDDDDMIDDDDDDLDEFLEQEDISGANGCNGGGGGNGNGNGNTRRNLIGPLVPLIEWNDNTKPEIFEPLQLGVLSHLLPISIDPFCDYWTKVDEGSAEDSASDSAIEGKMSDGDIATTLISAPFATDPVVKNKRKLRAKSKAKTDIDNADLKEIAKPPKSKSTTISMTGATIPDNIESKTVTMVKSSVKILAKSTTDDTQKRPLKIVSEDCIQPFLKIVQKSDMNQILLVEILKKEFPKISKEVIRNTLREVASRVGVKEADKVWVVNEATWTKYFDENNMEKNQVDT
ncbi:hypothetical protein NADFUDRAFT_78429 [Nadsonia fulvescens var. elongata DSM 6958]|uniref:DBINO domain-containing protein n=1 Tax=Nadsonia fulvescens var. elongata DSM 6958 TaxID=857566 RepID=A0A1E3PLA4_9ASCO|nr:hypothetical protein NADFUDRAFT_78429 [Nadsonia fulvescens var. elongata DSM 6958]